MVVKATFIVVYIVSKNATWFSNNGLFLKNSSSLRVREPYLPTVGPRGYSPQKRGNSMNKLALGFQTTVPYFESYNPGDLNREHHVQTIIGIFRPPLWMTMALRINRS